VVRPLGRVTLPELRYRTLPEHFEIRPPLRRGPFSRFAAQSGWQGPLRCLLVFLCLSLLFGGLGGGSLTSPPTLVFTSHGGLSNFL